LGANVTAEDVSSFVYDNKTYYLPKDKQVIDMSIPLEAITMQQFAEASDLLNLIDNTEDGFKFMSYAIAVLAWEQGQEYNEDAVLIKGKTFKLLDMQTVWGVFFCSISTVSIFETSLMSYSESVASKRNLQHEAQELNGTDGTDIFTIWHKALSRFPLSEN